MPNTRLQLALTLTGDTLCFLLFAVLGLNSHNEAFNLDNLARAAGPFWLAWLVLAAVSGLYAADWPRPVVTVWKRTLYAWPGAWLIGIIARALVFDRGFVPAFAAISFVTLGVFLVAWRSGAARLLAKRVHVA
jgi:hypothetical protein